jgi:hypothetical protein
LGGGPLRGEARAALAALTRRGGYGELDARFRIAEASSFDGVSLSVELSTKVEERVDIAYWLTPVKRRSPGASGADLLAAHARVSRAPQRLQWLDTWKAAGGERSIAMHVVGPNLHEARYGGYLARAFGVAPPWRHAELPGDPVIELSLLRAGNVVAVLFLSDTAPGALVVAANYGERPLQNDGAHWLDGETVRFSTRNPAYILVDLQGGHERRVIPEDFPALRQSRGRTPK